MVQIVQQTDPILRRQAAAVPVEKIRSASIKAIIKKMSRALAREDDGVAIAAPQIGELWRIFIVSGRLMGKNPAVAEPDFVFINPIITNSSKQKVILDEGCLSVRWRYGKVRRARQVTIEAYDQTGRKIVRHGSGLWAQIFQHEIDHLDGILFTDKAQEIVEIKPERHDH
jgi:peptide deformylase